MTTYDLYLESGPRQKKAMVHVIDLLGCVAVGPTTAAAVAATPEAIAAYRRFLTRHGDPVDPEATVTTRIVEHITEGGFLGNGSPYIVFQPDYEPLTDREIDIFLGRVHWLRDELATWAATRSEAQLDATSSAGRTERAILLHVLGATGSFLSATLGTAPGFSALHGAATRGELPLAAALRRSAEMIATRVRSASPAERSQVRELPAGPRTLRKAIRRLMEHDWEHLAELSRRPGGPPL